MRKEVIIDGVLYVPATEAIGNAEAIEKGLASLFYGDSGIPLDKSFEYRWSGLNVLVYDDGDGNSIDEVLAAIAKYSTSRKKDSGNGE